MIKTITIEKSSEGLKATPTLPVIIKPANTLQDSSSNQSDDEGSTIPKYE